MNNLFWRYEYQRSWEVIQVFLAWCFSYMFFLVILFLQLVISILVIGAVAISFLETPNVLLGLLILVLLVAYNAPQIHIYLRIRKFLRAARDVRSIEELPAGVSAVIFARIAELKRRMTNQHQQQLEHCNIRLLVERANHKATPCMITTSKEVNLIFPLGFFKVLKGDPGAADAMLAHELAHYLHKDSGLLLKVRCYLKAAVVNFYYMLLMFAIVLGFAFLNVFQLNYVQRLRVEGQLARLEERKNETLNSTWNFSPGFILIQQAREEAQLRQELHRIDVEILGWVLRPAEYLLAFVVFGLILLYLRRRVHRSEEIADFFACLITHPTVVRRFLAEYLEDGDYGFKSLHPRTTRRIELTRRYEADLVEVAPS